MDVLNDTSYSNIDNIKDLSPEKFEIYIEQAKSNAKLAKERELHRSVLAQKDQKINSMQSEMNIMKRTITNCKVIMTYHCCICYAYIFIEKHFAWEKFIACPQYINHCLSWQ